MQKIHITAVINAPREKVWKTMLEDKTYREWTSAFNPGSCYVGSWETGSKMKFLGPNPDGSGSEGGMSSIIEESRPYEFISIKHVGIINNGVEETESELAKAWTPAHENYTFKDVDGGTEFTLDMDTVESEKENMEKMWKDALVKLKEIVERN